MSLEMPLSAQQEARLQTIEGKLSDTQKELVGTSTALEYIKESIDNGFKDLKQGLATITADQEATTKEVSTLKESVKEINDERRRAALKWASVKTYVIPLVAGAFGFIAQKLGSVILAALVTP